MHRPVAADYLYVGAKKTTFSRLSASAERYTAPVLDEFLAQYKAKQHLNETLMRYAYQAAERNSVMGEKIIKVHFENDHLVPLMPHYLKGVVNCLDCMKKGIEYCKHSANPFNLKKHGWRGYNGLEKIGFKHIATNIADSGDPAHCYAQSTSCSIPVRSLVAWNSSRGYSSCAV